MIEPGEGIAKPVGEFFVDPGGRFLIVVAAEGHAAGTRLVRHDQGHPFIQRGRQEGGLAPSRVANDRDLGFVDGDIGHQIVDTTAQSPGPGRDGTPAVIGLGGGRIGGLDAIGEIVFIRVHIAFVEGGEGIAPVNEIGHTPEIFFHAPAFFHGLGTTPVAPGAGMVNDGRVIENGVVAALIQAEEDRDRTRRISGHKEGEANPWGVRPVEVTKVNGNLFQDCLPIEDGGFGGGFGNGNPWGVGGDTVDVMFEEGFEFGTSLFPPLIGSLDGIAVHHDEGAGEIGLIGEIVDGGKRGRMGGAQGDERGAIKAYPDLRHLDVPPFDTGKSPGCRVS